MIVLLTPLLDETFNSIEWIQAELGEGEVKDILYSLSIPLNGFCGAMIR